MVTAVLNVTQTGVRTFIFELQTEVLKLSGLVSPFVVHPQQVRSEDDSDVSGRHLVHVLVFSQFGEEFDQIPVNTETGKMSRDFFSTLNRCRKKRKAS